MNIQRVVCWYSCGITSTVATKLAIEKYTSMYPVVVAYCETGSEHSDNKRFLRDCEQWFGIPIVILHSDKYKDTWDVYEKTGYLEGYGGARCSHELKRDVRRAFENLESDLQIFGYDIDEIARAEHFKLTYPEVRVEFPLLDLGITKAQCINRLQEEGIDLPIMYKLGYLNNNCIGCVRGGAGYWNKIRKDFPGVFARMAKIERKLNFALIRSEKGIHFLDTLSENMGNYESELPVQCGLVCSEWQTDGFRVISQKIIDATKEFVKSVRSGDDAMVYFKLLELEALLDDWEKTKYAHNQNEIKSPA